MSAKSVNSIKKQGVVVMGKQASSKELRKQLREVVKEVLTEEIIGVALAKIEAALNTRLNEKLNSLESKQKDLQNYIVRQFTAVKKPD